MQNVRGPLVLGLVGIGLEVVAVAMPQIWPNAPTIVWEALLWAGIAIILAAVWWGLWPRLRNKLPRVRIEWQESGPLADQPPQPPKFFSNREVIGKQSPLADKMRGTERMYALWFTGTKALLDIEAVTNVKRLLLPNPHSKSTLFHQLASGDPRNIDEEIRNATKLAENKGIEVRWLPEFLGFTLTIGNPNRDDAWAQIEIALPVVHGSRHPIFEFSKPDHCETVEDMIAVFDALWENSAFSTNPRLSNPTTSIQRDVWLLDAICRAAFGEWEKIAIDPFGTGIGQETVDELNNITMSQIPQFAFDGKLPIWGKEGGQGVWKPVPKEFWESNGLDWFGLLEGNPEKLKTEPKQSVHATITWTMLMTSKTKVEELWPVENT